MLRMSQYVSGNDVLRFCPQLICLLKMSTAPLLHQWKPLQQNVLVFGRPLWAVTTTLLTVKHGGKCTGNKGCRWRSARFLRLIVNDAIWVLLLQVCEVQSCQGNESREAQQHGSKGASSLKVCSQGQTWAVLVFFPIDSSFTHQIFSLALGLSFG